MNRKGMTLVAGIVLLTTIGCSISLFGTPAPFPTSPFLPS